MANFVAGSLNLIPLFFLFVQTRFIFDGTLGSTGSHLRPRFAYILGKYGYARSQGGRQPAALPLYKYKYKQSKTKQNNVK